MLIFILKLIYLYISSQTAASAIFIGNINFIARQRMTKKIIMSKAS